MATYTATVSRDGKVTLRSRRDIKGFGRRLVQATPCPRADVFIQAAALYAETRHPTAPTKPVFILTPESTNVDSAGGGD